MDNTIVDEKREPLLLPEPVQQGNEHKRKKVTVLRRFARGLAFIATLALLVHLTLPMMTFQPCSHRMMMASKPLYSHDYSVDSIAGFTVEGGSSDVAGKVKFESSKVKKDYSISVDMDFSSPDLKDKVEWIVNDNSITLSIPSEGQINVSATISIPSDILIGKESLPGFECSVTSLDVDYSALGSKLEMDSWSLNVGVGNVKAGSFSSNMSRIVVGQGNITGSVSLADKEMDIRVAAGNVDLDAEASVNGYGKLSITAAAGNVSGSYVIESVSSFDLAKGDLYIDADITSLKNSSAALSTNVASGTTRVYVDDLEEDNLAFTASHTSISGNMVLTYPGSFLGRIIARNVMGDIDLRGKHLVVEKQWFGYEGVKGEEGQGRGDIQVRTFKGDIDFLVGDEDDE